MKLPALVPNAPVPVQHWGAVLHHLATASGCRTQRELAKQLHVAPVTMNRYLTCERLPDDKVVTTLVALTRANDNRIDTADVQRAYSDAVQAFDTWQPRLRNGQVAPSPPRDEQGRKEEPEPRVEDQATDGSGTASRARIAARIPIWARFSRLPLGRKTFLAAVAAAAIAGLVALLIRPGETSNEPSSPDPLPLRRYQAPTPDQANFISPTEPGPSGWAALPPLGGVYAPGENRVAGLVPIHRYRCTNCRNAVYFLSRYPDKRPNYVLEREAFRCFDPNSPPSGTRKLEALINDHQARIWAVPGTSEYNEATANGFKDPSKDGLPLCYIW